MSTPTLVLLSGGLDSTVLLHHLHHSQAHQLSLGLSFDYGSKHNQQEIQRARWQCAQLGLEHELIQLPFINQLFSSSLLQSGAAIPAGRYDEASMKQTVVPFRNAIMLSIAAGLAESRGIQAVGLAAHGGDHRIYPDCRSSFFEPMAEAMAQGTDTQVELLRPFVNWSKTQIIQRGEELQVNFAQTYSCYRGGEIHCGECSTCLERREAFQKAGVTDPTHYLNTPALDHG